MGFVYMREVSEEGGPRGLGEPGLARKWGSRQKEVLLNHSGILTPHSTPERDKRGYVAKGFHPVAWGGDPSAPALVDSHSQVPSRTYRQSSCCVREAMGTSKLGCQPAPAQSRSEAAGNGHHSAMAGISPIRRTLSGPQRRPVRSMVS